MHAFEAPIFSSGTWGPKTWSHADLDQIVANFNLLKGKIDPPVRFGHGDTQPFNEAEQPAAGWLDGVRRDGDQLIGSFTNVPTVVHDAIKQRLYPKLSAEIYHSFEHHPAEQNLKSGAKGPTLKAVALLGQTPPVVKTLGDLSNYLHGEGAGELTIEFAEPLVVDGPQDGRTPGGDGPAGPSAAAIQAMIDAAFAKHFAERPASTASGSARTSANGDSMTDAEKAELLASFAETVNTKVAEATAPLKAELTALSEAKTKAEGEITKLAEENSRIKADNERLSAQASKAEAERTKADAKHFAESRCTRENLRMYPTQKAAGVALYERLNASEPIVSAEEAQSYGLKEAKAYTARDLFSEYVDQHPATKVGAEVSHATPAKTDRLDDAIADIMATRKLDRAAAAAALFAERPDLVPDYRTPTATH